MKHFVEKVVKEDGTNTVVLVNENYQIVEPVAIYLEYMEVRGYALNTIKTYCRILGKFYDWLAEDKLKFYEVTRRDMISYIKYIEKGKELTAKTINYNLTCVGAFYDYFLIMDGYLENPVFTNTPKSNVFVKNNRIKKDQFPVNFFKRKETKVNMVKRLFKNEIEILYEAIGKLSNDEGINKRNQLLFKFMYETGCRVGETMGLRVQDYSEPHPNLEFGEIILKRYKKLYHDDHALKTNERRIPVSMDLIYEIEQYLYEYRPLKEGVDTLFVNHTGQSKGNYMKRSRITSIFNDLSNETGIKVTPHMLRHTHGSELEEAGYNKTYLMHRLGHNSEESTHQYIHLSYDAQLRAYENFLEKRGD